MGTFSVRFTVVTLLILISASVQGAQLATDFELSVTTSADRSVEIQCVRGCRLVVATRSPADGEMHWKVFPKFAFTKCQNRECSSGQTLGGVVTQSPSPDFDLWVANSVDGTVIKCVRGCKFAAVAQAPAPDDPEPLRVPEVRFPCRGQSCVVRISGWVESN